MRPRGHTQKLTPTPTDTPIQTHNTHHILDTPHSDTPVHRDRPPPGLTHTYPDLYTHRAQRQVGTHRAADTQTSITGTGKKSQGYTYRHTQESRQGPDPHVDRERTIQSHRHMKKEHVHRTHEPERSRQLPASPTADPSPFFPFPSSHSSLLALAGQGRSWGVIWR